MENDLATIDGVIALPVRVPPMLEWALGYCTGYFGHPLRRNPCIDKSNCIITPLHVDLYQGLVVLDDGSRYGILSSPQNLDPLSVRGL